MNRRMPRWLLIAIDIGLTSAVIIALARSIRNLLPGALEAAARTDLWVIAGSLCLVASGYLVRLFTWAKMASTLGLDAPTAATGRSYFLSYLGRYVPGNVGLLLVRLRAYREVKPGTVALATFLEYAAAMSAAFLLSGAGLAGWGLNADSTLRAMSVPCLGIAVLFMLPKPAMRFISFVFNMFGRVLYLPSLPSMKSMAVFTAGYTVAGLLHGAALFLMLSSMGPLSVNSFPFITGAYYLAGIVGAIAVFSPGGLGVREAILVALLPAVSGEQDALASTLLIRAVTLVTEMALCVVFLAIAGRSSQKDEADAQ